MSPELAHWLLSDEAAAVLAESADATATPAVVTALRKRLGDAERAAAVLELVELRRRAIAKFALGGQMFFTRKSYEQATDEVVARYKAHRFSLHGVVVDACCGIGGDLIGMANTVSEAIGIDSDPAVAAFAARNVELHGLQAAIETIQLTANTLPRCCGWHVDPDRRPAGRRTTNPDAHEPSLATLAAWRERLEDGAIKLAPAARLPADWEAECELEWLSRGGECRQLVAWCGSLAKAHGQRRATLLTKNRPPSTLCGFPDIATPGAEALGEWLHEPDPAVLAAGLAGALAIQEGLTAVVPRVAYLTSNARVENPLVASFEVLETMPLSRKRLAGWLSERGIGRLEIKCRGVEIRPEQLRRELKPKGQGGATLLIYPDREGKRRVVVARRPTEP